MQEIVVSGGMGQMTWNSQNEIVVTEEHSIFTKSLETTDSVLFGPSVERSNRSKGKPNLLVRLFRRLSFETHRRARVPFGKIYRRLSRQFFGATIRYRCLADGTKFNLPCGSMEVQALDNSDVAGRLLTTEAQYWILTRTSNQLLRKAAPAISEFIVSSAATMWFGDSQNKFGQVTRRPKFSRMLLRQIDALGPVVIVSTKVLRERVCNIPSNLWPLVLGLSLPEREIELVPEILGVGDANVSDLSSRATEAAEIVRNEIRSSGLQATVRELPLGRRDVTYEVIEKPLVSVVIPTCGTSNEEGKAYVSEAIKSILHRSTYKNLEFVIVADNPTPQEVIDEIDALGNNAIRWVRWAEEFNFSSKMNLGVACAAGDLLLMLNDDVELVSPGWIESMLSLINVDDIGAVGALLFFDDQTLQHAGHFYAGGAGHIGLGESIRENDPNQILQLDRLVSGATAACLLIEKTIFIDVGGFSTIFPGNYNDVDLCLKLKHAKIQMAVSGDARLYHFESKTRDSRILPFEVENIVHRWGDDLNSDVCYRT